uniref:Uncharacterized protein n=1 Tax=Clastoptera arizonana TaxID=38151 RepID=A0A1B6DAL0_9HEMI
MAFKYDICFLTNFTSLLFLTVSFGNSLSLHRDGECIQDGCKCIFPNNKFIDISQKVPLTRIDIKGENNSAIIFHPCQNFIFGNKAEGNECFDGASVSTLVPSN